METWKSVVGWEDRYEVSSHGQIRSLGALGTKPTKILNTERLRLGYRRVSFCRNGVVTRKAVHHVVLEAFVGPRPGNLDCNHKDGDPTNNHVENLEWVTRSENELHKRNVLMSQVGETHPLAVFVTIDEVEALHDSGMTYREAAKALGIGLTTLKRMRNGTHWSVR